MRPKGIGFTGTRRKPTAEQLKTLEQFLQTPRLLPNGIFGPICIAYSVFHHGDCIGADLEAHLIALRLGMQIHLHPPKDSRYRAYCEDCSYCSPEKVFLERNHDIVDASDLLIACPKEDHEVLRSGTWATVRYAIKSKISTAIIYPSGQMNCTIIA